MAKMNLKPLSGYTLIEPLEEVRQTASGIVLPDTATEKPQQGKVLAVGAAKKLEDGTKVEPEFKVGDVVVFKKWGGDEIKLDDKEYKLVKFEDVMAIIA